MLPFRNGSEASKPYHSKIVRGRSLRMCRHDSNIVYDVGWGRVVLRLLRIAITGSSSRFLDYQLK